jgi:TonB family protein
MRHLPNTLFALLLVTYLVTPSIALGKNKPLDLASGPGEDSAQAGTKNAQSKGEADLLLGRLKKRKERVIERCLENCGDSGDVVEILDKPQPIYPPDAKAKQISGAVVVRLVIDEAGKVMAAQAITGHLMLRKAATRSVRSRRFKPTMLSGQPVKVTGTVTVNFTLQ